MNELLFLNVLPANYKAKKKRRFWALTCRNALPTLSFIQTPFKLLY